MSEKQADGEELFQGYVGHLAYQRNLRAKISFSGREYALKEHIAIECDPHKKILIRPGFSLSYGEIMGLAGDFYGTPEEIVADSEKDILSILEIDREGGLQLANRLRDLFKNKPRYARLAYGNFEHFQPDAELCYKRCHAHALAAAQEANSLAEKRYGKPILVLASLPGDSKDDCPQDDEIYKKVHEAYFLNAFADHFLADSFASGHIRVPRIELHLENPALGGLRAMKMHDEENKAGLWVRSEKYPEPWFAWGDNELFADKAKSHLERIKEAIEASLQDVKDVLRGENPSQEWKKLIPRPLDWKKGIKLGSAPRQWKDKNGSLVNYEPMYRVEAGVVKSRE